MSKTPNASLIESANPAGAPSISELARALKYDVDLIYEFIANNIDYIPNYALHKGGLGALIDGSGNSFDIADLMVQLLLAPGSSYTSSQVSYVVGSVILNATGTGPLWTNFLNCSASNLANAANTLTNGGIPNTQNTGTNQLSFGHCWVQVNIGGTPYMFDPAMKVYNTVAGINLATTMGYSQAGFLTDARSDPGYLLTSDYVQKVSETSIETDLQTYSMNLVNWIKTNSTYAGGGATLNEVVGGQTIVPIAFPPTHLTQLPYRDTSQVQTVYTVSTGGLPASLKATLQITYMNNGINYTFNTAEVHGQRLTLWFDASNKLGLYLNGLLKQASATAQSPTQPETVALFATHKYLTPTGGSSNTHDNQQNVQISTNQQLAIGTIWGSCSRQTPEVRRQSLSANRATGASSTSESVAGEASSVVAYNVLAQLSQGSNLVDQFATTKTVFHHAYDLAFFVFDSAGTPPNNYYVFNSLYVELNASPRTGAVTSFINDNLATLTETLLMHTAETASIGQVTGVTGATPITGIQQANKNGKKIYNATSSNWTTVSAALAAGGWSSADITRVSNALGNKIAVPESPVTIGSATISPWMWTAQTTTSQSSQLAQVFSSDLDGAKGGISTADESSDLFASNSDDNQIEVDGDGEPIRASITSNEPIDLFNGRYLHATTDISVGNQDEPYSLSFSRSYNSGNRGVNQGLGLGWNHNFQINATVNSDGYLVYGDQSPAAAAAAIAVLYVANDIITTDVTLPIDKWVTLIIMFQWLAGQTTNNVALVQFGSEYQKWCKLSDGQPSGVSTYLPPLGVKASTTLTSSGGIFTYETPDKVAYNFNSSGQISSIVYPFGITTNFTYTSGNLTRVDACVTGDLTHPFRSLILTYNGSTLTGISDGNGRSVSYTIDGSNNLTQFTDALTNTTFYVYDQMGRPGCLTKIKRPANPSSPVVTNVYDTLSRVQTQTDAYNNTWTYYFAGSRSEEVDPNNNSHILYFDYQGNAVKDIDQLGNVTTTQYDGLERPTQVTLPEGNYTTFAYDALSNVLTVTATPKSGSGLTPITNAFTYDTTWVAKVKQATDGNGKTTTYTYDPSVPSSGRLTNVTYPQVTIGGQQFNPQVNLTYNSIGQLLTLTDPTSVVTNLTYDSTTHNLLTQVVDYGTGRLNLTTTLTYDNVGNLATIQDPNSNASTLTSLQFDANRRLTQKIDPAPLSYITTYGYDANGNLTQVQRKDAGGIVQQTYNATYTIDDLIATIIEPPINGTSSPNPTSTFAYDSMRRLHTESDAQVPSNTYTYAYDALSRVYQVTDPTNTVSETRLYQVNGQNQPSNGYLSSISDANGHATQYLYDGFDRLSKTTYADTTTEQYSYDNNSNVLQITTRGGDTIGFTYDALNQALTKSPPLPQATVTYSYDLAGRLTSATTPVVTGDPSTGQFQQFYDTAGRFNKEQYSDGKTVTLALDNNGNVTGITYPDGFVATRAYDQLNRLTGISTTPTSGSVTFGYDALSRRMSLTYGNGIVQTYGYDQGDNLLSLFRTGSAALQFSYTYNNVHQIVAKNATSNSYLWHPASGGTTTYGAANSINEYPTVNGVGYSYNPNGCLTGDGTFTYGYDTENRLVSATSSGTSVSFEYDPLGRQLLKIGVSAKTEFVYSGLQRIADYDGISGNLLNHYVFGDGLDEPLFAVSNAGVITYLHADDAGSVIATSDFSGNTLNQNVYSPFGESASVNSFNFGFTGQRFDPETGLYYYKARYYAPAIGRFLQTDPIGYAGGALNLYDYANNDGINSSDPLGLASDGGGLVFHLGAVQNVYQQPPTIWQALAQNFPGWNIFTPGINNVLEDPLGYALSVIPGGGIAEGAGRIVGGAIEQLAKKGTTDLLRRGFVGGSIAGGFNKLKNAIDGIAVHGNSNFAVGKYEIYVIRDTVTNEILKIGTTGRGIVSRFNQQIGKLQAWISVGNPVKVETIASQPTHGLAKQLETELLNAWGRFKKPNKITGKALPLWNKINR